MSNIYLKSADERTVVKLSNPKLVPQLHQFYFDEGYQVVEYAEFKKIRARIRYRSNHGAPNKACSRPPLARVGVGQIPCKVTFLQMSRPLHTAAANANRWVNENKNTLSPYKVMSLRHARNRNLKGWGMCVSSTRKRAHHHSPSGSLDSVCKRWRAL